MKKSACVSDQVGRINEAAAIARLEFAGHCAQLFLIPGQNRNRHSFRSQPHGNRAADALARTGDQSERSRTSTEATAFGCLEPVWRRLPGPPAALLASGINSCQTELQL